MITTKIKGAEDNEALVDKEGRLYTLASAVPPERPASEIRIFRQYMTNDGEPWDGTGGGNGDMRVVGSTASPQFFFINSASDADRYIDTLSFVIADASATLDKFGNITALTNGCELIYEDPVLGDVVVHDSLKSNFNFLRLCGKGALPIGATTNAFRASNVQGASEGYLMNLDFSDQFGVPYGLRIPKDSTFKIKMIIKDDTTGVDAFNVIAYGYDRIIRE